MRACVRAHARNYSPSIGCDSDIGSDDDDDGSVGIVIACVRLYQKIGCDERRASA